MIGGEDDKSTEKKESNFNIRLQAVGGLNKGLVYSSAAFIRSKLDDFPYRRM